MDRKKAALIVLWLVCFAGFFVQVETTYALVARFAFWGLLIIHAMQWLAFRELLKGSSNSVVENLTGTLLFGMVHVHEVRAEIERRSTGT